MILEDYLAYTKHSESPESYHIWTFLSMISAVVGKRCWLEFNYFNVFPNMYIILVSLPGVGKKSTAIRIGEKCIVDSEADVAITRDAITPQALILELEAAFTLFDTPAGKKYGSSSLTVFSSELVTLIGGNVAMIEFLTDIYDSGKKWEYKTKGAGKFTINNPCLNVISCVTTDIFCNRISKDAVSGGFISRSLVIYDPQIKVISPFKMPTKDELAARANVVTRFSAIKDMYGEVKFTPEAKTYYEEWYQAEFSKLKKTTQHIEFNSRKHIHVAKTAMLLAISEMTLEIDVYTLKMAIELLKRVEHNMKFIYLSAGASKFSETYLKILSALNAVDHITEEEILAVFMKDLTLDEFTDQVEMLMRVGFITVGIDGDKRILKITPKGQEIFADYV
jgi:predicted transcriptional regulator